MSNFFVTVSNENATPMELRKQNPWYRRCPPESPKKDVVQLSTPKTEVEPKTGDPLSRRSPDVNPKTLRVRTKTLGQAIFNWKPWNRRWPIGIPQQELSNQSSWEGWTNGWIPPLTGRTQPADAEQQQQQSQKQTSDQSRRSRPPWERKKNKRGTK